MHKKINKRLINSTKTTRRRVQLSTHNTHTLTNHHYSKNSCKIEHNNAMRTHISHQSQRPQELRRNSIYGGALRPRLMVEYRRKMRNHFFFVEDEDRTQKYIRYYSTEIKWSTSLRVYSNITGFQFSFVSVL